MGCGYGPQPRTDGPIAVSQTKPYRLYTHCGVISITLNHKTFYADPALTDGSGNPPKGWGNPYDDGEVTLTSATTADFLDSDGHRAHFSSAGASGAPTVQHCA